MAHATAEKTQPRPKQQRSGRPPLHYPEACQYLSLTEQHLKRLRAEGRIPYIKLSKGRSGRVLFDPDALDAWLEAHSFEPDA